MTLLPELLIQKMQEMISKRPRGDETCILLFIDIRNLSFINKKYGLRGGDKVLLKYGKILKKLLRNYGVLATTKNRNFILVFNECVGKLLDKNNIHIPFRRRKFDYFLWYANR